MILTVEASDFTGQIQLSTCSVTLVDTDKVITAGHCHTPRSAHQLGLFRLPDAADGSRLPATIRASSRYKVLAHHYNGGRLQPAPARRSAGRSAHRANAPPLPEVGEQVFGVHHPNGAVKKLSLPHAEGFATVTGCGSAAINVPTSCNVSGGSSGSGLLDLPGRITGVLSNGDPCHGSPLTYFPTATVLTPSCRRRRRQSRAT